MYILHSGIDRGSIVYLHTLQDALHRTLAQIGQGDIGALVHDYRHSTVLRHDKLLTTCKQLETAYTHILSTGELPDQLANILPAPAVRLIISDIVHTLLLPRLSVWELLECYESQEATTNALFSLHHDWLLAGALLFYCCGFCCYFHCSYCCCQ